MAAYRSAVTIVICIIECHVIPMAAQIPPLYPYGSGVDTETVRLVNNGAECMDFYKVRIMNSITASTASLGDLLTSSWKLCISFNGGLAFSETAIPTGTFGSVESAKASQEAAILPLYFNYGTTINFNDDPGTSGIFYTLSTDEATLQSYVNDIDSCGLAVNEFTAFWAVKVTWANLQDATNSDRFSDPSLSNTFQIVLLGNAGDALFAIINYGKISAVPSTPVQTLIQGDGDVTKVFNLTPDTAGSNGVAGSPNGRFVYHISDDTVREPGYLHACDDAVNCGRYYGLVSSDSGLATGTCSGPVCTCGADHSGIYCLNDDTNQCISDPCDPAHSHFCEDTGLGSEVTDPASRYRCHCDAGYTGATCDTEIPACDSNPCRNGGTCINVPYDFLCSCAYSWGGTSCEFYTGIYDIDECEIPGLCQHGGRCDNVPGGYECQCATQDGVTYGGDNCATELCEALFGSCLNYGRCTRSNDTDAYCDCSQTGFMGQRCEVDIDECVMTPGLCQHGGRCDNVPGGYECQCATQGGVTYGGDNCTTVVERHPVMESMVPRYGPLAGGTMLTITGRYLVSRDFRPIRVSLGGQYACSVISSNVTELVAVTPEGSHVEVNNPLPVHVTFVGGLTVPTIWSFTYFENPTITDLYPQNTILSGGTNMTVTGQSLNSVAAPQLEVTLEIKERAGIDQNDVITTSTTSEVCGVVNASTAFCPVPNIRVILPDDLKNYTITNGTIVDFDTENREVELFIGLKLDGYQEYRNISNNTDPILAAKGTLIVNVNPTFNDYRDQVIEYSQAPVIFRGSDLRVVGIGEYVVEIGQGYCNVLDVTQTSVTCQLPSSPPDKKLGSQHKYHELTLLIGRNQKYAMGFVHYKADILLPLAIGLTVAAVVILVAIATSICLKLRNNRRKRRDAEAKATALANPDAWIALPSLPLDGSRFESRGTTGRGHHDKDDREQM